MFSCGSGFLEAALFHFSWPPDGFLEDHFSWFSVPLDGFLEAAIFHFFCLLKK